MISLAVKLTISFTKLTFENYLASNAPSYTKDIVQSFCCDVLMVAILRRSCLLSITSLTCLYFTFPRNASPQGLNMIAIVVQEIFSCVLSYPFLHCWCLTCKKNNYLSLSHIALLPKIYSLLTLWLHVGHGNDLLNTAASLLRNSPIVWSVTRSIFSIFATLTNRSGDVVTKILIECIIQLCNKSIP